MGYFAKQLLRSMGLSLKKKEKKERVSRQGMRWLLKWTNACRAMAVGDTLDERMNTLLMYTFAGEVLHASYSELRISKTFEKNFPLTSGKLRMLFAGVSVTGKEGNNG